MKQGTVSAGPVENREPGHQESGSELGIQLGHPAANGVEQVSLHGEQLPCHDQVPGRLRKTAEHLHVSQDPSVPFHVGSDPVSEQTDIKM
jgi:hypothetical protein